MTCQRCADLERELKAIRGAVLYGQTGEAVMRCEAALAAADDKMGPGAESSIPRCDGGGEQPSAPVVEPLKAARAQAEKDCAHIDAAIERHIEAGRDVYDDEYLASRPAAPCDDYLPPLVADGKVNVTLREAGPLPPPTWDDKAAAPCETCGGKGHLRMIVSGNLVPCPDCAEAAPMGEDVFLPEMSSNIASRVADECGIELAGYPDRLEYGIRCVLAGAAAMRRRPMSEEEARAIAGSIHFHHTVEGPHEELYDYGTRCVLAGAKARRKGER